MAAASVIVLKSIKSIVFIIHNIIIFSLKMPLLKQSRQYNEQKLIPLKLACSKLDLQVKNASCFNSVLSAWFHF